MVPLLAKNTRNNRHRYATHPRKMHQLEPDVKNNTMQLMNQSTLIPIGLLRRNGSLIHGPSRVGKLCDWPARDQENEAGRHGGYQITAHIVIIPSIPAIYMFFQERLSSTDCKSSSNANSSARALQISQEKQRHTPANLRRDVSENLFLSHICASLQFPAVFPRRSKCPLRP